MSSSVPCYEAYVLASLTVTCATVAALFALISFGMYSITLHFDPNRKFVTTTKYDIESASWVLVLSAIGALSASSAVIYNFNCGAKCTSAEISCVSSMGTFGASFVAAFSAMCAAILKLVSLYFQLKHPQISQTQDAQLHQISVPARNSS